ncbi:Aste57867_11477 [Aphanomyces stellatus]|uniref:Aste57867_11477 protein n=1 Tax=Aphanomyces stellatus TaxID=120398 RepID=A0A485KU89_9STRA|nr:hypothetical protein As57867_011434 [Aphanomyces stellatus]VFT88338.1 Aste57867_11477 [Aphanomyces stellatus]
MRVQPRVPALADAPQVHHDRRHAGLALLGSLYIACSMASCMYYLHLLNPSFANDLWWAKYSPNGFQALVVDLFNTRLTTHATGSLDLLAPLATMDKTYDAPVATTDVYPTYVRRVLLTELTSIEFAVVNLRSLSAFWAAFMCTQYCWVDLDHMFEIAHTADRQSRCANRYANNGAVYLETVLRNQVWDDFMSSVGGVSGDFFIAIHSWLEQVPAGQAWLVTTSVARQTTTVDAEAVYWRAKNVTYFQLQWQNRGQTGIFESIEVENAFGLRQTIVLKGFPRNRETWTTVSLNWLLKNDLWYMSYINRSLVRSATNSFIQSPPYSFDDFSGLQDSNGKYVAQVKLFQVCVGPFLSIDTFYVATPPALLTFYESFQEALYSTLSSSPPFQTDLDDIVSTTVVTAPPSWVNPNFVYYGGSPTCLQSGPLPYIQQTFGFYDVCDTQLPLTVTVNKYSGTFAAAAMGNQIDIPSTCSAQTSLLHCDLYLYSIVKATNDLVALSSFDPKVILSAMSSITMSNISIMQYASFQDGTIWTLLTQPLLSDPAWAFFGWNLIYDWVQGKREVVSFEGDVSSQVLISVADLPALFPSSSKSITSATWLMYQLVVYVTVVLGCIAAACLVGLLHRRFHIQGTNSFWFNRTVSSIWIGRPLLFIRGVTAVLVLSTSQLDLVKTTGDKRSQFQFTPRSWLATMIVAGEATWILYVVHDFLSFVVDRFTKVYGPLSCIFGWVAIIVLELWDPVQPQVNVQRTCTSQDMDTAVQCSQSVLQIGSWERALAIWSILGLATCMALLIGVLYRRLVPSERNNRIRHLLGVGDIYLASPSNSLKGQTWTLDKVSCLMSGLVPIHMLNKRYTFDIKLWVIRQDHEQPIHESSKIFSFHTQRVESNQSCQVTDVITPSNIYRVGKNLVVLCGMLYPVGAIAGSVSYLRVSQLNLSNDLFWATFNVTGAHAFIANWLNEQLLLGVSSSDPFRLNLDHINQVNSFATAISTVQSSANYGAIMQYSELNTIEGTILGLRISDACAAPWIFTQYCFVDFGQLWEMANSAARQKRCQSMISNGAVFFEAILRNIAFEEFYACWGTSFEASVARELQQSVTGQSWLSLVSRTHKIPIANEVVYWQSKGITSFTTQWQNFKSIGLVNTYSIENALGMLYEFTLQYSNTTFRLSKQTTYKMYWGLANDLFTVAQNESSIGGLSLIRSSAHFAFANQTMQTVLTQNGTLSFPHASALSIVSNVIGPFGSVDLRFVSCPPAATIAVREIYRVIHKTMYQNNATQIAYHKIINPQSIMFPVPEAWTDINFITVGGNPLCPEEAVAASNPVSQGMVTLLSWQTQCSSLYLWTPLNPTVETMITSVILANMANASTDDIARTCARNAQDVDVCLDFLTQTVTFVAEHMIPTLSALSPLIQAASSAVESLNIEFVQFGQHDQSAPVILYRANVLDRINAPDFVYFSWNFLIQWTLGYREVILLEGDKGTITLLSELYAPLREQVNLGENPSSMTLYLRHTVEYVTTTMIAIAALVLLYLALSVGRVEIFNLALIDRVGAIVWIGRPLLFVRSLTGVALLSTASLELVYNGTISSFQVGQPPWYKTALAANEVAWIVTVVNDIVMVFTQEYTAQIVYVDSFLVWVVTAALSFASPISHSMSIDNQCFLAQVDAQVVCTSGTLVIGHSSRLIQIVCLALGCNALCYLCARVAWPCLPRSKVNSIFVYAGAKYLFTTSAWVYGDVYFMDRMSAVLNGILTLRWKDTMYALDVKLWRTFQVDLAVDDMLFPSTHEVATPARLALPLSLHPS